MVFGGYYSLEKFIRLLPHCSVLISKIYGDVVGDAVGIGVGSIVGEVVVSGVGDTGVGVGAQAPNITAKPKVVSNVVNE